MGCTLLKECSQATNATVLESVGIIPCWHGPISFSPALACIPDNVWTDQAGIMDDALDAKSNGCDRV